jgi:hypothetical protein
MPFEIEDTKSFDENLDNFLSSLEADTPALAQALRNELPRLVRGEIQISDVWDRSAMLARSRPNERLASPINRNQRVARDQQ